MATGAPATDRSFVDKIGWPFLPAVAGSAISVAVAFGLDLSALQVAELNTFVAALLGWVARQRVTPWKADVFADWAAEKLAGEAETAKPDGE
jgi:hypothetical protein